MNDAQAGKEEKEAQEAAKKEAAEVDLLAHLAALDKIVKQLQHPH